MNMETKAELLSHYFSSFRKSEQVVVYEQAVNDLPLLVAALKLHLTGVASGKVFETYQLDRLGEWVGWCFPTLTVELDDLIAEHIKKYRRNKKKAEVFSCFAKGLKYGRQEARLELTNHSADNPRPIRFEVVHPD